MTRWLCLAWITALLIKVMEPCSIAIESMRMFPMLASQLQRVALVLEDGSYAD